MGFLITYHRQDGHYIVHTKDVEVQFNKYEMGIPYIDSKKKEITFVQTVQDNFKGFTKK